MALEYSQEIQITQKATQRQRPYNDHMLQNTKAQGILPFWGFHVICILAEQIVKFHMPVVTRSLKGFSNSAHQFKNRKKRGGGQWNLLPTPNHVLKTCFLPTHKATKTVACSCLYFYRHKTGNEIPVGFVRAPKTNVFTEPLCIINPYLFTTKVTAFLSCWLS